MSKNNSNSTAAVDIDTVDDITNSINKVGISDGAVPEICANCGKEGGIENVKLHIVLCTRRSVENVPLKYTMRSYSNNPHRLKIVRFASSPHRCM